MPSDRIDDLSGGYILAYTDQLVPVQCLRIPLTLVDGG